MGPFIRLNTRLLISAHDMYALVMQRLRMLIQLADGLDGFIKALRVRGAVVIQPIT